MLWMKVIYEELMVGFFDLDKEEDFELDGEKWGYVKDEVVFKDYWCKYIKY